jgi:hypothetical protein
MSKISTLYDAIVTRIEAVLPSHTRIPNPYKIDENTQVFLNQGWGLSVAEGSDVRQQISCYTDISRLFVITLTRKAYSLESSSTGKPTTEKLLLEDQFLLLKDFALDPDLGTTVVSVFRFVGDGGIEYVYTETDKYLKISSTFEGKIVENLTS